MFSLALAVQYLLSLQHSTILCWKKAAYQPWQSFLFAASLAGGCLSNVNRKIISMDMAGHDMTNGWNPIKISLQASKQAYMHRLVCDTAAMAHCTACCSAPQRGRGHALLYKGNTIIDTVRKQTKTERDQPRLYGVHYRWLVLLIVVWFLASSNIIFRILYGSRVHLKFAWLHIKCMAGNIFLSRTTPVANRTTYCRWSYKVPQHP